MIILEATSTSKRKYKCPYCNNRYTRIDMSSHIEEEHEEMIPKDVTPLQITFNTVNKKKEYNGRCTECGGPTTWDENKGRYNRQCSEKCKQHYVQYMKSNMKNKYGKEHLLDDINQQNKMLKHRSISGTYIWSDGSKKDYVGTYEKKALEFMDKVLRIKSEDLITPGPVIEYEYNDEKHQWITDMYYVPYNLCFDIKDGGSNPNTRNMQEYRAKQDAKEAAIAAQKQYNYIRLTDNNFGQLMSIFFELKMNMDIEGKDDKIIRINEEVALSMNVIPPTDYRRGGYIIPYMMKNTFTRGYAYTDNADLTDDIHMINFAGKKEIKHRDEFLDMVYDYSIFKHKRNIIDEPSKFDESCFIDEFYYELTGRRILDEKQIYLDKDFIPISKLEDKLQANTNVVKATMESTSNKMNGENVDINGWYMYNESTGLRTKSYDRLESIPKEELNIIENGLYL